MNSTLAYDLYMRIFRDFSLIYVTTKQEANICIVFKLSCGEYTHLIHCGAKNATFYFCNNFVKPHCISIIFDTHILK